ncbi:MAG TPA: polysaccharide biosynthesis tyrosine autokinase [Firmicutes bacterium]|nr:polysaccharide biosynthesis tyrosine autokinase [Bacillota bacterium]
MQRLSNLETLYVNTVIERQIDETRLEEIKRLLGEQKRQVLPEISHYTSPLVERFRDKLSELEYERALLLREFTPEHQEVKDLTYEIEQTQQVLAEEVKGLMEADLPTLDPLATYKNLLNEMIDLQLSISTQKRREAVLAKTVDHYVNQLENLADKEIEVSRLRYKIEVKKNTYERFLQKKEQVELSIAMETGDVQVLDYAFSALDLTGHQKATTMAWSMVAALLGATGIAFFLDMNDKRIKNEGEVKKVLGLPLMGMVPKIRLPHRGGLVETVAHYEEGTPYAESFRKLRTQIEFKSIDTPLKTILCTSTRQEEGKTTVITNLGISFAQKGERVLIVDCDLRRPALHKSFATRRSPGLSDILVEDTAWQQVVQETDIPNLYILTSGERPRNPSELLGSARMKTLIEQFSAQFDRVLFDISSVLAVTDSAVLGPICDGVILTVKAMEVPRDYILQAIEILNSVGSNMLGVALNGVKISRRSYYYYYYSEEALAGNHTAAAQPS